MLQQRKVQVLVHGFRCAHGLARAGNLLLKAGQLHGDVQAPKKGFGLRPAMLRNGLYGLGIGLFIIGLQGGIVHDVSLGIAGLLPAAGGDAAAAVR